MFAAVPRLLLCLCLVLSFAACDRSSLDDDDMDDPPGGGGGMMETAVCTASIDGSPYEARTPSATTNDQGSTFSLACESSSEGFLFELRPSGFGEATLALGAAGNQVQYSEGLQTTNTALLPAGENAGSVTFTTFTRDRAIGSFSINVPGFEDGDPVIRVTAGFFNVPVRLNVGGG